MKLRILAPGLGLLAAGCVTVPAFTDPDLPPYQLNRSTVVSSLGVPADRMFEATQNWSDKTRTDFWHIDQGSLTTPYDLALAVEQYDSEALFFADENIARYKYVPQNKGGPNPDGLPLGFTKSQKQANGETYIGLTCAACHSTVMTYKGTGLMIDGAPSQADFQSFFEDLTLAFWKNRDDPAKFARLTRRLLGDNPSEAEKEALETRLEKAIGRMIAREKMNATKSRYGYGRVDAVGQIFNSVAVQNIGIPENRVDPNAPVNYPFLWGIHQSDRVQWNGFAPNIVKGRKNVRIFGPFVRNAGEVLGVFGEIDIPRDAQGKKVTYPNSTRVQNLLGIEEWLEGLAPPPWPEDILGPIDRGLAAKGEEIYKGKGGCIGCHTIPETPFHCYNATMVPLEKIGTDPGQALNSLQTGKTGPLEGRLIRVSESDGILGPEEPILKMLVHQVIWGVLNDVEANKLEAARTVGGLFFHNISQGDCDIKPSDFKSFKAYKARPLNSIWATAPYLHNGSVPNLRALLTPEEDRPKTFKLGGWEFDPVNVGYADYDGPHAFEFDTSLKGNSNKGHNWKSIQNMTDADRDALIEYLKTL